LKKILLALLICGMASSAFAADLGGLGGKVGVSGTQESSIMLTNYNLELSYPVNIGDIGLKIVANGTFWNGGGVSGSVASVSLETAFNGNGRIYVKHNEGTDYFRGSLSGSNEAGIYYTF